MQEIHHGDTENTEEENWHERTERIPKGMRGCLGEVTLRALRASVVNLMLAQTALWESARSRIVRLV